MTVVADATEIVVVVVVVVEDAGGVVDAACSFDAVDGYVVVFVVVAAVVAAARACCGGVEGGAGVVAAFEMVFVAESRPPCCQWVAAFGMMAKRKHHPRVPQDQWGSSWLPMACQSVQRQGHQERVRRPPEQCLLWETAMMSQGRPCRLNFHRQRAQTDVIARWKKALLRRP